MPHSKKSIASEIAEAMKKKKKRIIKLRIKKIFLESNKSRTRLNNNHKLMVVIQK